MGGSKTGSVGSGALPWQNPGTLKKSGVVKGLWAVQLMSLQLDGRMAWSPSSVLSSMYETNMLTLEDTPEL